MDRTQLAVDRLTRRLAALGASGAGVGAVLAVKGRTPGLRAFGQQTAAWGAIDLAIAGVGAARRSAPPSAGRLRTVLLVNAALDVGYIAAGAYLAGRRPGPNARLQQDRARGHGLAVVTQGALLLALDLRHALALGREDDDGRPRPSFGRA